ncbi:hypothetical protein J7384_11255 [Endozoicomonas sp. G2_1]|uniref:hypothetical protein n=1 Tax=Endozoicomonas sp. G2_1 TaxID=2821091 RepID=UPI001ADCEE37|nr:hypothetical protein [Endozoicomonas sp. G2_1]MBO9490936.1 hypothetical protein [Endozoicomonas sp. G2_1]
MSIFTSIAIAVAVWFVVWLQPNAMANSALGNSALGNSAPMQDQPAIQSSNHQTSSNTKAMTSVKKDKSEVSVKGIATSIVENTAVKPATSIKPVELVGVSQRVALTQVNQVWQSFRDNQHLLRALKSNQFDVYAVYRNFNNNFTEADLDIGYQRSALNDSVKVTASLPVGKRVQLLASGQHNDLTIASVWQNIDYSREIIAVIERHQIDAEQDLVSVDVIYQDFQFSPSK